MSQNELGEIFCSPLVGGHMQRELKDIGAERLTMAQATIVTTFAKRHVASCFKGYRALAEGCNIPNRSFVHKGALSVI